MAPALTAPILLLRNFARSPNPAGSNGIPPGVVGAIVAGSVVATTLLSFCIFFLLRRCKRRRMPTPTNQMAIDETHRSLEEMIRESETRKITAYGPTLSELPRRSRRISKLTGTTPSPTSSDEGHGTGPYSLGPFSPLSPINFTPDMPLPPVPMPSTRFSLVPSEHSHNSHHRQLSRTQSMYIHRRSEVPIQEIDAGVTLLPGDIISLSPPVLPPAYIPQYLQPAPSPSRSQGQRSLSLSDAKAHR